MEKKIRNSMAIDTGALVIYAEDPLDSFRPEHNNIRIKVFEDEGVVELNATIEEAEQMIEIIRKSIDNLKELEVRAEMKYSEKNMAAPDQNLDLASRAFLNPIFPKI